MDTFRQERGAPHVLLLLGEFQSVAEDLDSRLFMTESTCLGRLTAETEHLPKEPRERHKGHMTERKNDCGVMRYADMMYYRCGGLLFVDGATVLQEQSEQVLIKNNL